MRPVIAIVGRPNVGKSTLVNRLSGKMHAIVDDLPGVTRDRIYLPVEWFGTQFTVIDTGGIIPEEEDSILKEVQLQVRIAINEANVIIFVVDCRDGVTPIDIDIALELRKSGKKIILAVNKVDNDQQELLIHEFYALNVGDPISMSAIHSTGVDNVIEKAIENFPEEHELEEREEKTKMSIVGKPNVGKSSILNSLLGFNRVIVHNSSGTTRDSIDTDIKYHNRDYVVIDTAGIRKKSKVGFGVDQFSMSRSIKAMNRSDAVILVIDSEDGATEQDQKIAGMIKEKGKGTIVVINKWDLIDKDNKTMKRYADDIRKKLYFLDYAPILFTSALTKKRLFNLYDLVDSAVEENNRRVKTGLLNQILNEALALNPPPRVRGKSAKVLYITQATVAPPTFIIFVNNVELISQSYVRYLENKIREAFGFIGTPLRFLLRNR